ncbi:MAG: YkgJ family cysteine cluster protein [bacterium]
MSEAVKKIKELLKLPQKLCNMCGSCCKIATFKAGLSYEQILELIANPETDPTQVEGAKDFLTIFEPYYTHDDIKKIAPDFYERVMKQVGKPNMSFFRCRFIGKHGGCLIHEDRPLLCRMYPVPHERTMFFPGCGFEEQSIANWKEIEIIIEEVRKRSEQTS